jgi:hypothetical protein
MQQRTQPLPCLPTVRIISSWFGNLLSKTALY